jgi:hypothetical protein
MIRQTAYWQLYAMRPDGIMARFGDAYAQGPARTPLWQPAQDYYARITRDPGIVASADYFRTFNEEPYHRWRYGWTPVLTYDPHVPMPDGYDAARPAEYLNTRLPRSRVFGRHTLGQTFLVDRWGDADATWIGFKAGDVLAHHGHYDQGNFVIFRGSPLAVHSGVYADYFSPYRLGYFVQTVAVNSILVDAPGEFSNWSRERGYFDQVTGGQRVIMPTGADIASVSHWLRNQHTGAHYETGDILAFESEPGKFDYICADITAAYNSARYAEPGNLPKVSSVVRKLVYLREPKAVVILDRVVATDPDFSTRWLLHTPAKPESEAEALLRGESADDGVLRTEDRWLHTAFEDGQLFHQVLLPDEADVTKIGGPHHRHYVELSSGPTDLQPRRRRQDLPPAYGMWRTEVADAARQTEHLFLNVLWPRLADEDEPERAHLAAAALPAVAVAVDGWVIVFRTEGQYESEVSYNAPVGTSHHLVLDVWPRSGWRQSSHDDVAGIRGRRQAPAEHTSVMHASGEGVLTFAAGAGPMRLIEVSPRDGPGHQ